MFSFYDKITSAADKGVALLASAFIPRSPFGLMLAGAGMWYGRRVALTYAPGYIAQHFINMTITFVGSATFGKMIGFTVVAPMLTPSVVPFVATLVGCLFFCLIALICNVIQRVLFGSKKKTQIATEAETISETSF